MWISKKSEQRVKQSIKTTVMVVMMCDGYDLAWGWQALLSTYFVRGTVRRRGVSLPGMFAGSAVSVSVK